MWALRGLRQGVLTTRWPRHPDEYAAAGRGPVVVLRDADTSGLQGRDLAGLCPSGAISLAGPGDVQVDQGACIQCGRCIARFPEIFGWGAAVHSAALRQRTRALQRSVHLRHVDAGSDGSEEWEILALLNPVYDIHRLGIFLTASPRHADILLVTGAGAHGMAEPLRETYEAMPYPKVVIAVGTDACGGGLVSPSYATAGGIGAIVPVDVWLPGSPPSPFAILSAILLGLGRLPEPEPGRRAGAAATGRAR